MGVGRRFHSARVTGWLGGAWEAHDRSWTGRRSAVRPPFGRDGLLTPAGYISVGPLVSPAGIGEREGCRGGWDQSGWNWREERMDGRVGSVQLELERGKDGREGVLLRLDV